MSNRTASGFACPPSFGQSCCPTTVDEKFSLSSLTPPLLSGPVTPPSPQKLWKCSLSVFFWKEKTAALRRSSSRLEMDLRCAVNVQEGRQRCERIAKYDFPASHRNVKGGGEGGFFLVPFLIILSLAITRVKYSGAERGDGQVDPRQNRMEKITTFHSRAPQVTSFLGLA